MTGLDPARMSREQLIDAIGELLAAGAQRALAHGFKPSQQTETCREQLAVDPGPERPCGRPTEDAR